MKTGSFRTYTGPGRVCVARSSPRNAAAGYRMYKPLAPGAWFQIADKAKYLELYVAEVLKGLDPKKVYDDLYTLAAGAEPVLLCHEVPPFTDANFCHRRMVADWFQEKLGIDVPELVVAPAAKVTATQAKLDL